MLKLNIRPLNEEALAAGEENVSLVLSITVGGNVVDADITVEGDSEGVVGYSPEGTPTVTFEKVNPGEIIIKATKDDYEAGLLEITVPDPEEPEPAPVINLGELPETAPEPEPTPVPEPELPVGSDAAVVLFAESLRLGFTFKNLDRELLENIISGLSALESFVASAADGAAKTAARETISLVTPQIPELKRKVLEAEKLKGKVNDNSNRLVVVEDTLDNLQEQTEEDRRKDAEDAVKKAMGKNKLLFL